MRMAANLCLIKLPQEYSDMLHSWQEYQLTEDVNIKIDTSFDPAKHAPTSGELVRNPAYLVYEKGNGDTIQWDTDIETLPGDTVWFDYLACLTALGKLAHPITTGETPAWFRVENDLYIALRYDALIFAFRPDSENPTVEFFGQTGRIICLNGNVVFNPIVSKVKSTLILPDHVKNKEENLMCDVVFCGSGNREYLDGTKDPNGIEPGDRVILKKGFKVRLENRLDRMLAPGLFYLQKKYVWAVVE